MKTSKHKRKTKSPAALPLKQDLVVLAADKDTKEAIDAMLSKRTKALGIRPLTYSTITHPQHDPGCFNQSIGLLAVYHREYRHALVIFDREGCGREEKDRVELEKAVEASLAKAGWDDRAAVVVIDPELENWVWSPSPHVAHFLGWNNQTQSMKDWLVENEFLAEGVQCKPDRPKEAMEAVLRFVKRPRSSAIYRAIAEEVSLSNCADPAFKKLCETLQSWFPNPTD